MMKKRIVSALIALVMVMSCVTAFAENARHERVYAVLNADGSVQSLTDSIRLENPEKLDVLTDSTMLTGIENVAGDESFTLDGQTLTWQAGGKEITYQGTSDKPLPVTPVVTATLDGQEIPVSQLKDKDGEIVLTVTCGQPDMAPHLAASVILLPESGISDLTVENGTVLSLSGRQVVLGWTVPGADAALKLPSAFTIRYHGNHADLGWMMTFASADPIQKAWSEVDSRMDFNPRAELQDVITLLNALQNGEPLPEAGGKTKEIPDKINRLNSGLQDLNNGAQTLSEGASALSTGLAALSSNSEALNSGADTIFSAILETANQQLAASGLAEAGIEVPVLTADNYADTLTSLLAQFDTETVTAAARSQVEAVVRPQVKASEGKIRSAVTETIQAQVLEQVLVGAGMEMNAETYLNAVRAGQVEHAVQQKIQAAVDTQMETDTVKELIEAHTAEQIEQLVSDNTDQVLATDETVAAKLAQVQAAHDSLQGLLEELNKVGTFVTGLKTYTAGVDQAAAGAADLSSGAAALHDSGTDTLLTAITGAEKTVAEKLLPVLTGDISAVLDAWNQISGKTAGYDLRNEAFETTTLYVIRTDFN